MIPLFPISNRYLNSLRILEDALCHTLYQRSQIFQDIC